MTEMFLSEFIDFNPTVRLPKGTVASFVPMDSVIPWYRDVVATESKPYTGGTKFLDGDILLARITPSLENGKTSIYRAAESSRSKPAFGSTEFIVARGNEGISDTEYIYYLLRTDQMRSVAIASMTGSSGRQRVQLGTLESTLWDLPDLVEQRQIATTLGVLDDKIESNQKQVSLLEEILVAYFQKQFALNHRNGGRERVINLPIRVTDYVANGSFKTLKENVTLSEGSGYATFIRNTDLKNGFFSKSVDQKSYEFLAKTKLFGGEVIISNVGDVGSVYLCPKLESRMTLGNNILLVKSESELFSNAFLYCYFRYGVGIEQIKSITGGSAQPKFNKTDFRNLEMELYDEIFFAEFNRIAATIINHKDHLYRQNYELTQLRDAILPELMSGRIRVPEAREAIDQEAGL